MARRTLAVPPQYKIVTPDQPGESYATKLLRKRDDGLWEEVRRPNGRDFRDRTHAAQWLRNHLGLEQLLPQGRAG